MRRLVVCCDGTWNDPRDGTNVRKLWESVARTPEQPEPYYDEGVGAIVGQRILGGAFGQGLSRNIREAYRWLATHYQQDDELFFFGFSRGAFTVRSLVGFVRACGLLRADDLDSLDDAYDLYRKADGADAEELRAFRAGHNVRTIDSLNVAFLGVWETVGALGIPVVGLRSLLARRRWKFHDYRLSSHVKRAYQALAIDEKRTPFLAALWCVPEETEDVRIARRSEQHVEQVWFAGSHSDVGGRRATLALEWMMNKAKEAGLEFDKGALDRYAPASDVQQIRESLSRGYRAYAGGVIRSIGDRDYRNQDVDASAIRLRQRGSYDPENLRRWEDGDPMQEPKPLRWWYTIPGVQRYYLRQYAELGCETPEA